MSIRTKTHGSIDMLKTCSLYFCVRPYSARDLHNLYEKYAHICLPGICVLLCDYFGYFSQLC